MLLLPIALSLALSALADPISYTPPFTGRFRTRGLHAADEHSPQNDDRTATGDAHADWTAYIREAKAQLPPYPSLRFEGKGIVMSAGGATYFTCAYVNIRAIRETHKCSLPIEVFYNGMQEMSAYAVKYMEDTFANVRFIDINSHSDLPAGVSMKSYAIKIFSILHSSFKEVLYIDADNIPATDPSFLFELKPYLKHGALFWPDFCNMHSTKLLSTWDLFDLPRPSAWHTGDFWSEKCQPDEPYEIESGELVVNKKKVWNGLMMTAFINAHSYHFHDRIIMGDKQTFSFGFNASGTPYEMVRKHPFGIGLSAELASGEEYFCANTVGQRHPITGELLFLHRNLAKWVRSFEYSGSPRGWTHIAKQHPKASWEFRNRTDTPKGVFLPTPSHPKCIHPVGSDLVVKRVPKIVSDLEAACLGFLQDMNRLPFYPTGWSDCAGPKKFFCDHP